MKSLATRSSASTLRRVIEFSPIVITALPKELLVKLFACKSAKSATPPIPDKSITSDALTLSKSVSKSLPKSSSKINISSPRPPVSYTHLTLPTTPYV